jgi:hypothetical protein
LNLLFKNIKIAPATGGALPQKRISFFLFAPFNFFLSETQNKLQCQKNQKLTKICPKKSTSAPSDGRWPIYSKSMQSIETKKITRQERCIFKSQKQLAIREIIRPNPPLWSLRISAR